MAFLFVMQVQSVRLPCLSCCKAPGTDTCKTHKLSFRSWCCPFGFTGLYSPGKTPAKTLTASESCLVTYLCAYLYISIYSWNGLWQSHSDPSLPPVARYSTTSNQCWADYSQRISQRIIHNNLSDKCSCFICSGNILNQTMIFLLFINYSAVINTFFTLLTVERSLNLCCYTNLHGSFPHKSI